MSGRIEKQHIISEEALQAPLEMAKNLEAFAAKNRQVIDILQKTKQAIAGATNLQTVQKETENLGKAQTELNQIQQQIATQAKQRSREEIASLEAAVKKRQTLQEKIKALNKDQKDDLELMKRGVISREEYTKRLVQSNIQIKEAQLRISQLNKTAKDQILITKTVGNEYQKLSLALDQARTKYKNMAAAGLSTKQELRDQQRVVEQLNKKVVTIDKAVGQFQRNVGNYSGVFGAAARSLTSFMAAFGLVGGITLFARIMRGVIDQFIEFEYRNSQLKAVLSATGTQMRELRAQQLELGRATQFTSSQVAEMQVELAKLGFPTEDIKAMTKSTLDAALAMGSGLAETAALTGATLKAFNLPATESARVNDVLSKATASSALSFQKLATGMPYVGAVAKKFGFTIEETAALLGELSNAGFDASMAATATRKILLLLADDTGKLAKRLKEPVTDLPSLVKGLKQLKEEGIDLGEALELTDVRSVAAFSTFIEGSDSIVKLADTLNNAEGAAAKMAETMADNLRGDVLRAKSAWEGFYLSLIEGDSWFNTALRKLTQMATAFFNLLTPIESLTKGLIKEQAELNVLVGAITDVNVTTEARKVLIDELQSKYPNFLKNLNAEKVTNEELSLRMADVNKQFERKILLTAAEEQLKKLGEEIVDTVNREADARKAINELERDRKRIELQGASSTGLQSDVDFKITQQQQIINLALEERAELQKELTGRTKEYSDALGLFENNSNNYFKAEEKISETIKTRKVLTEEEKESLLKLQEFRLELAAKNEQDQLKKIDKEVDLELFRRANLLRNEELLANERQLIIEKSNAVIQDLESKRGEILYERQIENLKKAGQARVEELQKQLDAEVALLQQAAIDGEITQEEANKRIAAKRRAMADDIVEAQIAAVEKILGLDKLSADERAKYEAELYKLKTDLMNAYYDQLQDREKTGIEKLAENLEKIQEIYRDFSAAIIDLSSSISANRIEHINAEINKVQEQTEREIALAGDNEEAKKQIRERGELQRQQLEKKRLQEQRKAAIKAKAAALIEAAINIAVAVTKALRDGGFILGIPMAAAVGALGAIQLAAIAAKPIPQYAEGTDFHPGGAAIVGDGGGAELMRSPSGKWSLSPDKPTLIKEMERGTRVFDAETTTKMLALNQAGVVDSVTIDYAARREFEALLKETKKGNKALIKAVSKNKPGNLYRQGSLVMEAQERENGNKKLIRRSVLGK